MLRGGDPESLYFGTALWGIYLAATKVMIGGTQWFNGFWEQKMFGSLVV